jgi:hypothetical protein
MTSVFVFLWRSDRLETVVMTDGVAGCHEGLLSAYCGRR